MSFDLNEFWQLPPVTRTILAWTAAQSILCYGGLLSFQRIVFVYPWVFKFPPEIWRVATAFFLTGPKLGIIFDLYFLYIYGSACETQSPRFTAPGDFFTFVIFVQAIIFLLAGVLLSRHIFTSALILAFAYIFAQDNRNRRVGFIIFQIPAQYLPWSILFMTFVMNGQDAAITEATGLVAAHLYDFLTRLYPSFQGGRNWIQTPAIVRGWFGSDGAGVWTQRSYGTAFRPSSTGGQAVGSQQQPGNGSTGPSSSATGRDSGIFPSSWRTRGAGRRLGGD